MRTIHPMHRRDLDHWLAVHVAKLPAAKDARYNESDVERDMRENAYWATIPTFTHSLDLMVPLLIQLSKLGYESRFQIDRRDVWETDGARVQVRIRPPARDPYYIEFIAHSYENRYWTEQAAYALGKVIYGAMSGVTGSELSGWVLQGR